MKSTVFITVMTAALCVAGCKKEKPPEDDFDLGEPAAQAEPTAAVAVAAVVPVEAPLIKAQAVPFKTDPADVAKGKDLFATKGCTACHKIGGGKLVGPDLKGVTARRQKPWLESMILQPDRMVKEDETAKELLKTHLVPMPNQGVDPEKELQFILAYLKSAEN